MRSDEPTRVAQLVARFHRGQSGTLLSDAPVPARLTHGADHLDDCAVFDLGGPVTLVAGSDYVRGPKFALYEQGLLSHFDIGYFLVAANVSDIAAMGAAPLGVLTVVRYPHDLDDDGFHEIMAGINRACDDLGTLNVGGDIGSAERIIVSGAALGVCAPGTVLTRAGAQPGDLLCVTGPCGLAGAAVAYFPTRGAHRRRLPDNLEHRLLAGWRRPTARVAQGRLLSQGRFATSCQDTSDGLKATIEQLAAASGVGFDIHADAVAIDAAVAAVATLVGVDEIALAMSGSPDFQLAFTLAPQRLDACRQAFACQGLSFDVIGQACDPANGVRMTGPDGGTPLPGVTWRHQSDDLPGLLLRQ
ncbi:MAG TPA: thiamine-phosphate kinase [Candidatus Limnocylindrales bacterium]|nr:thiamine-phosphate kinase [Candidatus Limnocylindrales bacterium]